MFSIIPPPATENRVLCQTIIYILMARQSVRLSKTRKLSLNLLTVHQVSNPELSKEKAVMLPITNQSMTVFSMHFVLSLVSCTIGTGSFPGVKSGRGVTLTPQPLLVSWSRKSRAIPLFPNGYRLFSGGKEPPGRDVDPSTPSSVVVKAE